MNLTCILLLVLGLLLGGIIGLWSVRKDDDDSVVVVEENKEEGTTSVKEGEKKSEDVIQLGGDSNNKNKGVNKKK